MGSRKSQAEMGATGLVNNTPIPQYELLCTFEGIAVATKAPKEYLQTVRQWLHEDASTEKRDSVSDARTTADEEAAGIGKSARQWLNGLASHTETQQHGMKQFAELAIAVATLRERMRQDCPITSSDLDEIWSLIYTSIIDAEGSELQFLANRSAQGFLAVPLCSLLEDGHIKELWRFHSWLPDHERGNADLSIHAHQPYAQSWILAGCGTDLTYHSEFTDDYTQATHATYGLKWTSNGQTGSNYQTHQTSSTVTNTGRLVKVNLVATDVHTRDMSYCVKNSIHHLSVVPAGRFHSTLFVFDSSRGFDADATVLGPKDGKDYTQLRTSKAITAKMLAQIAHAVRRWEQEHDVKSESNHEHPTILAYYNFFVGMGLLQAGKKDEALDYFNPKVGLSPAQAFANDPSPLHRGYIQSLFEHGADLNIDNGSGYTALDYAIYNQDPDTEALLVQGLALQLGIDKTSRCLYEAKVRKGFREVFENQLRPLLIEGQRDRLKSIRQAYARAREGDSTVRQLFDGLRYVWYADFCKSERLPRYSDGTLRTYSCVTDSQEPEHIIYLAYRWIHKDPITGKTANDDREHTQYRRMLRALEGYLQAHPDFDRAKLGIWMDSCCIDRKDPLPGIAALPINLAQCNVLITVEDDLFWTRAWCSVEALIFQTLRRKYGYHQWYRYLPAGDITSGSSDYVLQAADLDFEIDMSTKSMTWDADRDKIKFLERQARLL